MATSRRSSPSTQDVQDSSPGRGTRVEPNLSASMPPPEFPRPAEGAATASGAGSVQGDVPPAGIDESAGPGNGKESGSGASQLLGQAAGEPAQPTANPPEERMSDEERQLRIAQRAYSKAQERGFSGDRELDDWLEAEREHNEGR